MMIKMRNAMTLPACLGLSACLLPVNSFSSNTKVVEKKKPNIVFFLTEDLSPHYLKLFNENHKGADTPFLDKMAREGYTYTNAYSNAPVSSAARTTLITGCFAPRFGGSFHRKLVEKPMPEGLSMFPTYLRQNGYFTCNAAKTDYNVVLDEKAWDIIHGKVGDWRKRKDKSKPFFYQRSNVVTHESKLQFSEKTFKNVKTRHDPNMVYVHPYLPDTELMRYTYATFYDRIEESDQELGKIIQMLKDDGELDNTFIFYFGDNGGSLPGTKGYTDDIGLHVPLVVYIPKNYRNSSDLPLGIKRDDLISFMDLGPTALNLAGISVPKEMDGKPILGKNAVKNESVYCYGDRFDELYAFNRVVRKGQFRYARNYQPYHPQSLYALYRYKQLAFKEWKDLYEKGQLNEFQSTFFQPFDAEELYDLKNDPLERNNLAKDVRYKNKLQELRNDLSTYLVAKADLGFYPETIILEEGIKHPAEFGAKNRDKIANYQRIANLQLKDFNGVKDQLKASLNSQDAVERWWGLTTLSAFASKAESFKSLAIGLLQDNRSFVRSRAITFLSRLGVRFEKNDILQVLAHCKTGAESMLVLNDVTYLVEGHLLSPFVIEMNDIPKKCNGIDWRVIYLNEMVK